MRSRDKVVVEVALNEYAFRTLNPHVPYSPAEIARAAQDCYDAGAAIVHFHAREPETGATPAGIPRHTALYAEAMRLIGESTPLIAYPTLAGTQSMTDPAVDRYYGWYPNLAADPHVRLEIGMGDLGEFPKITQRDPASGDLVPSATTFPTKRGTDLQWILQFNDEHGMKPAFAVFDTDHIRRLKNMIAWQWTENYPLLVHFLFGPPEVGGYGMPPTIRSLNYLLDEMAGMPIMWAPLVYETDEFPMNLHALAAGGDVRIGLGEYQYPELDCPTNAQLVERIVTIARAFGREPATPDEAREILGLNAARERARQKQLAGV
jgi:uncharacterized protein (DUF849 family)